MAKENSSTKSASTGQPESQPENQPATQPIGKTDAQNNMDSLTFRQAMSELDSVVSELDSNTLELEDSLKKYERGAALVRALRTRLDEAQQRVDVLMGELEPEADDAKTDTTLS